MKLLKAFVYVVIGLTWLTLPIVGWLVTIYFLIEAVRVLIPDRENIAPPVPPSPREARSSFYVIQGGRS